MFSARGAISTSVAMMECAKSQTSKGGEVFLLSELEKAWAAMSILIGKLLLEGKNVKITHFGAFWLEDFDLITDLHQRTYSTRKLRFGLHPQVATRYSVNTTKVPLETRSKVYAKVSVSQIVPICEVPAHRATLALRDFFLYIGEGLFTGKVFQLKFPGVATLLLRKEQLQVSTDWELQLGLFEVDAKRWPADMRGYCQQILLDDSAMRGTTSASSSRPSTARSTSSWRRGTSSGPIDPKHVFTSATKSGRLFSEIEKEHTRRRSERRSQTAEEEELKRRMREAERQVLHFDCAANNGEFVNFPLSAACHAAAPPTPSYDAYPNSEGSRPATASGESIYRVLDEYPASDSHAQHAPSRHFTHQGDDVLLPEEEEFEDGGVEVVEVTLAGSEQEKEESEAAVPRPLGKKNPELESVLQKEEAFARPISRRTYHDHCSVRDLIYRSGREDTSTPVPNSEVLELNDSEKLRFGRKRFDVSVPVHDHVASLLKVS